MINPATTTKITRKELLSLTFTAEQLDKIASVISMYFDIPTAANELIGVETIGNGEEKMVVCRLTGNRIVEIVLWQFKLYLDQIKSRTEQATIERIVAHHVHAFGVTSPSAIAAFHQLPVERILQVCAVKVALSR